MKLGGRFSFGKTVRFSDEDSFDDIAFFLISNSLRTKPKKFSLLVDEIAKARPLDDVSWVLFVALCIVIDEYLNFFPHRSAEQIFASVKPRIPAGTQVTHDAFETMIGIVLAEPDVVPDVPPRLGVVINSLLVPLVARQALRSPREVIGAASSLVEEQRTP